MNKGFVPRIVEFIKQYPGILYSLFLILFLPLILYFNTFLITQEFQKNIDHILQTKVLTIENILGTFFSEIFDEPSALQEKVMQVAENNAEISSLSVVKEATGGKFEIIASQNVQEVGEMTKDPSFVLSYSQDQVIANLSSGENGRAWNVVRPIYNKETGEKEGLISMSLSLKETDELIVRAIFRFYVIVLVTILLSLFLVFQHTRLFGYVSSTKKLQELDKMKDDFIRMTTHELQTPITTIRGYLDILEGKLKDDLSADEKESFRRVDVSAKTLSELINDILEVSRIQQGRLDFTSKNINPSKIISEVMDELDLKAKEKNLILTLEADQEDWQIKVNEQRFRQIMVNLVNNSIKYTFKGTVSVRTVANDIKERYTIEIKDTGVGISAEAQKKLFERFYRVKTQETAGVQGTGLGLWITKQLVEKMGGEIFVESMEGSGTKFTVVFPLVLKK